MHPAFVNREGELRELDAVSASGGLLVIFGRRRVGKTRLIVEWLSRNGGFYTQAIEGPVDLQIEQAFQDVQPHLQSALVPRKWEELLELFRLRPAPWTLCIDEFPYLVSSDASLPSRFQKWIDHSLPWGCTLILAGSSRRMMNDIFLKRSAPLFGRARKLLQVRPMSYQAFCQARGLNSETPASFQKFSLVGGIPKYWEFVASQKGAVDLAEALYFGFAPYMELEPQRVLQDEWVGGMLPLSVLEMVGRGAERPSEVAARLGTAQTNLSRIFQQLLDASLLRRDLPFGESVRSTRKTLYRIEDPAIRFWFRVYSPHQTLWRSYGKPQKLKLIDEHASTVFEDFWRERFPGSQRYWEKDAEFDLVWQEPSGKGLLVAEIKWRRLSVRDRRGILTRLEQKWSRSRLGRRFRDVRFEVFDATSLQTIAEERWEEGRKC